MILSYSLDVRQLPLDIFLNFMFSYLNFIKFYHVWQNSSRGIVWKKWAIYPMCHILGLILQPNQGYNLGWKNQIWYNFNMKTSKLKKMSIGSCLTSKLYDKIIKMISKSHETIPLTCSLLYEHAGSKNNYLCYIIKTSGIT
jgi:hypothetical protein